MSRDYNNIFTASRASCAMSCWRKHYWAFEIGLYRDQEFRALYIGGAWARAMEARWKGATYEQAIDASMPADCALDQYDMEIVAALLAGYYDYWGPREKVAKLHPEVRFKLPIEGAPEGWTAEGILDGLGTLKDNTSAIVETKTTGDSIEDGADYWMRLSFNMQLLQYTLAAIEHGWDVRKVFYDVTRKPSIKPKYVYSLDDQGRKIVVDKTGKRIFKQKKITKGRGRNAKTVEVDDLDKPRLTGDKEMGWEVKEHIETPSEFSDRLWKDTVARPSFYYVRREAVILRGDLLKYQMQRLALIQIILVLRELESQCENPEDAWPRNVSDTACSFCQFKSFCLAGVSVNPENPPAGYAVEKPNAELTNHEQTNTDPTFTEDTAPTGGN